MCPWRIHQSILCLNQDANTPIYTAQLSFHGVINQVMEPHNWDLHGEGLIVVIYCTSHKVWNWLILSIPLFTAAFGLIHIRWCLTESRRSLPGVLSVRLRVVHLVHRVYMWHAAYAAGFRCPAFLDWWLFGPPRRYDRVDPWWLSVGHLDPWWLGVGHLGGGRRTCLWHRRTQLLRHAFHIRPKSPCLLTCNPKFLIRGLQIRMVLHRLAMQIRPKTLRLLTTQPEFLLRGLQFIAELHRLHLRSLKCTTHFFLQCRLYFRVHRICWRTVRRLFLLPFSYHILVQALSQIHACHRCMQCLLLRATSGCDKPVTTYYRVANDSGLQ